MKRFAIASLCVVGLLSGCNDGKPKVGGTFTEPTYKINGEFAVLDEGPNGESMYIKIQDSTYQASHGQVAFDVTVTNKGKVTLDAPIFRALNNGKDCGEGLVTKSTELIRQGESRKITIIWECGDSVNPKNVDLFATFGNANLIWTHN